MLEDFAVDNMNFVVDKIRFTLRAFTFFIDKPRRDRYAFWRFLSLCTKHL